MSKEGSTALGTDWTRLLNDPDLIANLGKLLQVYREAPPEKRDEALVAAMREIKNGAVSSGQGASIQKAVPEAPPVAAIPHSTPPFEPDIFTPSWGQDRRRYPRMKCFVAVELRVADSGTAIWGNLSNTSLGGCLVETPDMVPTGVKLDIGLWLASGKIWVKGLALNGIATNSTPSVRIRFGEMQTADRENLQHFLKYVLNETKGYASEHGYLAQLKR
jgi:hypothetical protein